MEYTFDQDLHKCQTMERSKTNTFFGLAGWSAAEWAALILVFIGISLATFSIVYHSQEFVGSRTVGKHNVNIQHKITPFSQGRLTEKMTDGESVSARALDDASNVKEKHDTLNEHYDGEVLSDNSLDEFQMVGSKLKHIEGLSPEVLNEVDINYDYEIDVNGLPDDISDYYDDIIIDDMIDVDTKQENDFEETKADSFIENGLIKVKHDIPIKNFERNKVRKKNVFDKIDFDTHNHQQDRNEIKERSDYVDMIDVDTHLDNDYFDDYDEYDEFYVDKKNNVLDMIDTNTQNIQDRYAPNDGSKVHGARTDFGDIIDVSTFKENERHYLPKDAYEGKSVNSYDIIDTDTFEEDMADDLDCTDGYCSDYDVYDMVDSDTFEEEKYLFEYRPNRVHKDYQEYEKYEDYEDYGDYDEFADMIDTDTHTEDDYHSHDTRKRDYSDMIDLGTRMEEYEADIDGDDNYYYDMIDLETYEEVEHEVDASGANTNRYKGEFHPALETKVEKMIRAMKEVEL